jgi:hypothetical protein
MMLPTCSLSLPLGVGVGLGFSDLTVAFVMLNNIGDQSLTTWI